MQPWFIATERFTSGNQPAWDKYIAWSGLTQLDEVVSLDSMLCPTALPDIKGEYWSHIVNEDYTFNFFVDLEFLLAQLSDLREVNLLCVYRNPGSPPPPFAGEVKFEFLGYDLVYVDGDASALTNCGGFPDVFANSELSSKGLLRSHARAIEIQDTLRTKYPDERHADCHVWAISRAVSV